MKHGKKTVQTPSCETLKNNKRRFAELLVKNQDSPTMAALALFPDDEEMFAEAAANWIHDPEVIKAYEEAKQANKTNDDDLLTKSQLAREVEKRLQAAEKPTEYTQLARLYAELRGFIEKPQPSTNVNVAIPKAIEIPVYGNSEDWEKTAQKQQRGLVGKTRIKD